MSLDLEDLRLKGGQRHECSYAVAVSPISLGGAEYEVLLPEGAVVCAERVAGGFLIRLSAEAKIFGPCSRCLGEVELTVRASQEEFAPTAPGGWAETGSTPFIDGMVVDVSGLTREALVLAMPGRVLCSASCQGLCPQCGVDRNRERCSCGQT